MKHSFYRMHLLISYGLFICTFSATAQGPITVQWDKTIGGSGIEYFTSTIPSSDGGYLLSGSSSSPASGDKSEDSKGCNEFGICSSDYWIVKIDEDGNKQWDKTFGGSDGDFLRSTISTSDGGYLLAGHSTSPASGDKSEDRKGGCAEFIGCSTDYWIVKIDEDGNKQWDKTIGGSDYDFLSNVITTPDGGYLLSGSSYSSASGDKSENSKGNRDYWIIKIDEDGNKVWDKTIGGSSGDELRDAIRTADGGYLLSGSSSSPASGDKSENSSGSNDYWIVKIDEDGNKQWDKTIGGSSADSHQSTISTSDGGYLLSGSSYSSASGDKSENRKGQEGSSDYWIVKIDENGNKVWDKTIGGSDGDFLTSTIPTSDGSYLLSGYSDSPASGDKSENSKGQEDYWIVKIDEDGNKQWDKTIGGSNYDFLSSTIPTSDGSYLLSGYSDSPASGDKSENRKGGCDEEGNCDSDYWIVKVVESEEEDLFIKSFALIDAETDEEIQEIKDEDVIDLAKFSSTKFSIEAITEPSVVGSVAFRLEGRFIHGHTENHTPYAIFGDNPAGDFSGRLLPPGEYTLTATPYAEKNKAGVVGKALEISFTIINSDEIEDSQVTAFALYDAVTDEKLMDLAEGTIIHTDELAHEELTVLMHTVPDFVGSVKVELWGPMSLTRIENTKPYALFRNNSKDFFGEVLPAGEYTLRATPYTTENAQGEAGEPLEISFTVVGEDNNNARLAAYPVPTSGVVNVSYQGSAAVDLMLLDFTGQPLLTLPVRGQTQLDLSSYRKGIYYIKVVDQQGVQLKRVVVE